MGVVLELNLYFGQDKYHRTGSLYKGSHCIQIWEMGTEATKYFAGLINFWHNSLFPTTTPNSTLGRPMNHGFRWSFRTILGWFGALLGTLGAILAWLSLGFHRLLTCWQPMQCRYPAGLWEPVAASKKKKREKDPSKLSFLLSLWKDV